VGQHKVLVIPEVYSILPMHMKRLIIQALEENGKLFDSKDGGNDGFQLHVNTSMGYLISPCSGQWAHKRWN
jgi:hypothetical protein